MITDDAAARNAYPAVIASGSQLYEMMEGS